MAETRPSAQDAEAVRAAFDATDYDTRNAIMAHDMRLYLALCYLVERPKASADVADRLVSRRRGEQRG